MVTALAAVADTDEDICRVLHGFALTLYGLERYAEGEYHLRRALTGRGKAFGSSAPETIDTLARLAEAIGEQGRWIEAEALAREAFRLGQSALGVGHDVTPGALLASAWVTVSSGIPHADTAARAVVMALEGSTHAASARNLLVVALRKSGRYEEAEDVARETLVMRVEQLGPDHPHTLLLRSDLALTLHAAGRTTEALALAEEGLAAGERALGLHAPCTARLRKAHETIAA
ncbi:tetratricopeptide repeat protein [Streptomyces sp. A5-4]|uniref:tetratricopeptide repeat protein n=1 Tax=Streptomyces sp. A5-4 TaxID=3384771 RepID=UPI003DAA132F